MKAGRKTFVIAPGNKRREVMNHDFDGNADALVSSGHVGLQRNFHHMENIQYYKEIAALPTQRSAANS